MDNMAGGGGGWSSLPVELLGEISCHLSAEADRIHIHQVCAHWRNSTAPLAACRPWILAGRWPRRQITPIGDHSLWLPRGGGEAAVYRLGLPHCCGAPRGWLALTDSLRSPMRFILWEPISKAEIPMPCLHPAAAQVFLSGDPLASPPEGWIAVASCQRSLYTLDAQDIFFWRPGDAAWTASPEPFTRIDSAAFHRGRLYLADSFFVLAIYDLGEFPPKLITSIFLYAVASQPPRAVPANELLCSLHVVACGDSLLLVLLRGRYHPASAEVFRLELNCAAAEPSQSLKLGERVTDLGDYSLFLGRGEAFALSAKEFPAIRPNCVYFAQHEEIMHQGSWAVVFDLGSDTFQDIPYPQDCREDKSSGNGGDWLAYSWFCLREPFLQKFTF